MSTIEDIFKEAKTRCYLLRESIDRGLYDSPQPAKKIAFQEKLQQIIKDGEDHIKQYYKKKHGIKYRFKNKKSENSDKDKLFQMVLGYQDDLTNRLNLLNYYINNRIQDENECRDMSEEKCTRSKNISHCHWIPGGDKLGEWMMRKTWAERKNNNDKPEYVGVVSNQKPRGCYPVSTNKKTNKPRILTSKELKILQLKGNNESKELTAEEIALSKINTKRILTNNQKAKKVKRQQDMRDMMERLNALKKTRRNNTSKKRNNTSKKRNNTIKKRNNTGKKRNNTSKKRNNTGKRTNTIKKRTAVRLPVARKWNRKTRHNGNFEKIYRIRGGKRKKRLTAKEYWKGGRFLSKTWWMPRSMKTASWFHDTLKYGIPI